MNQSSFFEIQHWFKGCQKQRILEFSTPNLKLGVPFDSTGFFNKKKIKKGNGSLVLRLHYLGGKGE